MSKLKNGYVYVWDAKRKRHNYEHRLVIEEFLGRDLLPTETVHHKNGIKDDNRVENLVLCKTMADHVQEEGKWGPIKQSTCNFCEKPHHARGLCNNHYMVFLRREGMLGTQATLQKTCSVCDKPLRAKGLCASHYMKMKRGVLTDI